MKKIDTRALPEVLDHVSDITESLAMGVAGDAFDSEEMISLISTYSALFAQIVTVTTICKMPKGCEGQLPERIDDAVAIFHGTVIANTRETLELNGIPDPWRNNVNRRTFAEIMKEIENEETKQH
jgi:hypothetical protein